MKALHRNLRLLCVLLYIGAAAAGAVAASALDASAVPGTSAVPGNSAVSDTPTDTAPIVVVLSWDGVRHDYPALGNYPALQRMAREGVRAGRLLPVFPSATFPGHVSMATGTYPDRHGIVDNRFFDAVRGYYRDRSDASWIEAEPVWIAAERQGVPAATYFWVGSETDWRGRGTRYRIAPYDSSVSEAAKAAQIVAWLGLPEAERPRLIMSYWSGTDDVGHDRGPASGRLPAKMATQDAALAEVLKGIDALGLWPRTTLLVVSDHGMTASGKYLDVQGALADAGVGARIAGSVVAEVYVDNPEQVGAAGAVLKAVLAEVTGARVHAREGVPAELRISHPLRSGDWLVILPPPWTLSRPAGWAGVLWSAAYALGWDYGGHGYDAQLPDMAGIFFAMGRGVPADLTLDEVRQIDLAATVSRLLNIEPPASSEGQPMWQ
ncbi:MAG: ectonucleotide pyrophosphatase/phosphodiesterase [Pseudomonadales bacterium]|nr:alkaline phosphatase family protein [Pseudomonadales bacterium]